MGSLDTGNRALSQKTSPPKPFGFCKVYVIAKVLTPLSAPGITFYVPVLKVPSAALARLAEFAAHEAPFEEPELWPLPAD